MHVDYLLGKPDIVMKKYNLCIFVHGCFWHFHEWDVILHYPRIMSIFGMLSLLKINIVTLKTR
ncbi:hypothetical protein [Serratia sarumanii]|uniref:hypothetical protein n=1 Tax=Serratia sarumanii TaxID=3020826 RepID=UPI003F6AD579